MEFLYDVIRTTRLIYQYWTNYKIKH